MATRIHGGSRAARPSKSRHGTAAIADARRHKSAQGRDEDGFDASVAAAATGHKLAWHCAQVAIRDSC